MKRPSARQRIIETASHLFYQNGYNLTGINEIIREAGVAKATLYSHFASKDEICLAYLQHKNAVFMQDIRRYAQQAPAGKARLLALFGFVESFFGQDDFNGCWCLNTVSEIPREKEMIREEIQGQKTQLIGLIEELLRENLPQQAEQPGLAQQIYLLYEGAISESYLHQDSWPIVAARTLCEKILR